MMLETSKKQMMGDTRIQTLTSRGASQTLPAGWIMRVAAIENRPQKAELQDTKLDEPVTGC
jgi:hypothetical protein